MSKADVIEIEGTVVEKLPNAMFQVELENGRTSSREVVHHHGGAGIVALNEKGEVYLVRQYRYALDRELIEIPAGKLEAGEDPFEAAKRELGEEAGLQADTYVDLSPMIPTCGYCSEIIYLYAAKDLHPVGQHLRMNFCRCSRFRWSRRWKRFSPARSWTAKPAPPC